MDSSTMVSFGCHVATMTAPTDSGRTSRCRSRSMKAAGGGVAWAFISFSLGR